MRSYELMVLINPEIDDEAVEGLKERVRRFVADNAGEWNDEDHWGRRKLAYRIGKFTEANYFLVKLNLDAAPAKALEGTLNASENILRHLLVRQEE